MPIGINSALTLGVLPLEPFKSLNSQKASKLAFKLCNHSVQYAYNLVITGCALEKTSHTSHHHGQEWGTASHPPDPR